MSSDTYKRMISEEKKHRGVVFDKRRNTWFATIKLNGKGKYLGAFSKFEDAVNKRLEAEKIYRLPILLKRAEFESSIVNDYNSGLSMKTIADKIDVNQSTVRDILLKHKTNIRNGEILIDEEKCLSLYKLGKTVSGISNELGVSFGVIRDRLTKNSVIIRPNRRYTLDETMFETIDCEWKSYYLGLFYADGGVYKNSIKLSLSAKDRVLIDKLNEIIYNNKYNLYFTPPKEYFRKNKRYVNGPKYSIQINSKKVISDLNKLGCTPKKSFTLEFPSFNIVPENLFNHFLRGYFDGDGWVIKNCFGIISSDNFCFGLNKFFSNFLNVQGYLKKENKISRLHVHKRKDIEKICSFLYKNATIFLERKHNKFLDLKYIRF